MGESQHQTYSPHEIETRLKTELPRWSYRDGFIWRRFGTHGWKATLMVVNAIGHLAEAAWHHPELHVAYSSVDVRLQSHDAGGITDKDFELAKVIEKVVLWRPEKENGALAGTPKDARHAYLQWED